MTLQDRLHVQRLFAFRRAAELGNVSAACRDLGLSRALFCRWKHRGDRYGADGLHPRRAQARRGRPPQVPAHVERTLIALALAWPTWGPQRLAVQLTPQSGLVLAPSTVYRAPRRAGLGTRSQRLLVLEQHSASRAGLLTEGTRRTLEQARRTRPQRHVDATVPGELVCIDCFYVGKLKGVGKVWQITACDWKPPSSEGWSSCQGVDPTGPAVGCVDGVGCVDIRELDAKVGGTVPEVSGKPHPGGPLPSRRRAVRSAAPNGASPGRRSRRTPFAPWPPADETARPRKEDVMTTEPSMTAQRAATAVSRALTLLYGIGTYLFFFGTFLYLIGFVGNWVVPKGIDDGTPAASPGAAVAANGLLLGLFALQHTIMARPAFKEVWTRWVPGHVERSTFVLLSTAILAVMAWQWRPLPEPVWRFESPLAAGVLTIVSLAGWGMALVSTFLIDHFELFGVKQTVSYALRRPLEHPRFRERLFYRWVRHPLMLGFLIAFWATPTMSQGHLLFAVLTTLYVLIAIQIEERTLVHLHGEQYRSYQRRVSMLLPFGRRKHV